MTMRQVTSEHVYGETPLSEIVKGLFSSEKEVDLSSWPLDNAIVPVGAEMTIAIKGFKPPVVGFAEERNRITRTGVTGSADRSGLKGKKGAILRLPSVPNVLDTSDPEFLETHSLVGREEVKDIRAFRQVGDTWWIGGLGKLVNVNNGQVKVFKYPDNKMSFPHSVDYDSSLEQLLITMSGTDQIVKVCAKTGTVSQYWNAMDHGYKLNIGTGEQFYYVYSDERHKLNGNVPPSFEVVEIDRENRPVLPNAHQVAHPNSGIFHPRGRGVLATLFATKEVDENGVRVVGGGSGGQVINVVEIGGRMETHVLVRDLSNPHEVEHLGDNVYMVTNTSAGEVLFYRETEPFKWDRLGVLSTDNLPDLLQNHALQQSGIDMARVLPSEEHHWLQTAVPTGNLLTCVDVRRHAIELYDLSKQRRWEIPIVDPDVIVHKAQLVL